MRHKPPSQHEQDLYRILDQPNQELPLWVTEARVLGGSWGAADVYFPSINAMVMVDGEHHFPGGSGRNIHGHAGSIQLWHDLLFNVAAVSGSFSVLRLHYQDKALWLGAVLQFVRDCSACTPPFHRWVPAWKYIRDAQYVVSLPCTAE